MSELNIVKVKSLRYSLDWFDIKDVEINIDDFYCFEIQNRLGNWYLMHFVLKDNKITSAHEHDFQLTEAWLAVNGLKEKITSFNSLHGVNHEFVKSLNTLFLQAENYKLENKEK